MKKNTKLTKKYTQKDAKEFILNSTGTSTDSRESLRKLAKSHLTDIHNGSMSKKQEEEVTELLNDASKALSVETGYSLMQSVEENNHGLAIEIKRTLQEEFDCKNYSEKMLVDLITNAYIRGLSFSNKLVANQQKAGGIYEGYRNHLSKEVDKAFRQYITGIETLKCMKQPPLNVTLKTETAFISQNENQQINNQTKDENNEV